MALTTKRLATLLVEELARDEWGDIDMAWLEAVASGDYKPEDAGYGQAAALAQVLDRVVARLDEPDVAPVLRWYRVRITARRVGSPHRVEEMVSDVEATNTRTAIALARRTHHAAINATYRPQGRVFTAQLLGTTQELTDNQDPVCVHEWSVDEHGTRRCIGCGEPRS